MRLSQPLVKLPIRFDADTLAAEVNALPPSVWVPHASGFPGNEAVRLVTPGGQPTDAFEGPMKPTKNLARCPYIMQTMAELGGVWGRSRLMGLGPGAEVPEHIDSHYHWRTHLRIHVPAITNPEVHFTCGGETVHMAAGECWVFDSFRLHEVHNRGQQRRVHLVLDTLVSEPLWDLLEAAQNGTSASPKILKPGERGGDGLLFEQFNVPEVMSPWEIRGHIAFVAGETTPHPSLEQVMKRLDRFADAWASLWAQYGPSDQAIPEYRQLLGRTRSDLQALGADNIRLKNKLGVAHVLDQLIFTVAGRGADRSTASRSPATTLDVATGPAAGAASGAPFRDRFERPIFIVSTPRSGSTLLFETLAQAPGLYTVGGESHALIEDIPVLAPAAHGWASNRLTAEDAAAAPVEQLARAFYEDLRDRDRRSPEGRVRLLEKTPKNALRVPFFDAAWPDATFVYLYRDVRETLSSMIEAWLSVAFRTYPELPGWTGRPWSMLLVPGWQRLNGQPLRQVVAQQWAITTELLLDDLAKIPKERLRAVVYGEFLASPQPIVEDLAASLGLPWDRSLGSRLPFSKTTVSQPKADKWRAIEDVIEAVWPIVEKADARARAFVEQLRGYRQAPDGARPEITSPLFKRD